MNQSEMRKKIEHKNASRRETRRCQSLTPRVSRTPDDRRVKVRVRVRVTPRLEKEHLRGSGEDVNNMMFFGLTRLFSGVRVRVRVRVKGLRVNPP